MQIILFTLYRCVKVFLIILCRNDLIVRRHDDFTISIIETIRLFQCNRRRNINTTEPFSVQLISIAANTFCGYPRNSVLNKASAIWSLDFIMQFTTRLASIVILMFRQATIRSNFSTFHRKRTFSNNAHCCRACRCNRTVFTRFHQLKFYRTHLRCGFIHFHFECRHVTGDRHCI